MRAVRLLPAGGWDPVREVDTVLLDFDLRHRRRVMLHTEHGADLLLDLPQPARLVDGDGLELETGGVVRVRARPEALLEITAEDPAELARIAWHLGNRHLPVQILAGKLRIRPDHVIAGMIEGLGGRVTEITAAFDPEAGAYAGSDGGPHHHGHDHHHEHDTNRRKQ